MQQPYKYILLSWRGWLFYKIVCLVVIRIALDLNVMAFSNPGWSSVSEKYDIKNSNHPLFSDVIQIMLFVYLEAPHVLNRFLNELLNNLQSLFYIINNFSKQNTFKQLKFCFTFIYLYPNTYTIELLI